MNKENLIGLLLLVTIPISPAFGSSAECTLAFFNRQTDKTTKIQIATDESSAEAQRSSSVAKAKVECEKSIQEKLTNSCVISCNKIGENIGDITLVWPRTKELNATGEGEGFSPSAGSPKGSEKNEGGPAPQN